MNIEEFKSLYESDFKNSGDIFERWDKENRIDELLNTPIAPGVVLFDVLHGDQALDQIKPELREAFETLSGHKADTYEEIREKLYEKIELGDRSVDGMISKILGPIGENAFMKEADKLGLNARLAESGSQPGWDVAIDHNDKATEYVQVKLYAESDGVISHIKEVNERVELDKIMDGERIVKSIDFAVPENIYDEVVEKVNELDLNTKIYSIPMTSEEGRDIVELGFGFSADASDAVENFFSELFGSFLTVAALHGLANGFLLYKGAKNSEQFIYDTLEQTTISTGAITTGMGVELILTNIAKVGGIPSYMLVLGTTITAREILKRIANRQSYVDWLRAQNTHLNQMILNFN
ncbi:MAG: hypothetical protein IH948_05545 [Bacteroidetes bacterium]|nr:hypothetical protein [Bacteroidota bacterium]